MIVNAMAKVTLLEA